MKITRFESFIERAVPYFIIGLLLVILLVMGSCSGDVKAYEAPNMQFQWTVIEINGCDYIVTTNPHKESFPPPVHHANCKNHKPCE